MKDGEWRLECQTWRYNDYKNFLQVFLSANSPSQKKICHSENCSSLRVLGAVRKKKWKRKKINNISEKVNVPKLEVSLEVGKGVAWNSKSDYSFLPVARKEKKSWAGSRKQNKALATLKLCWRPTTYEYFDIVVTGMGGIGAVDKSAVEQNNTKIILGPLLWLRGDSLALLRMSSHVSRVSRCVAVCTKSLKHQIQL